MSLEVTRTGRAIARTGLQPVAMHATLAFLGRNFETLKALLIADDAQEFVAPDDFEFVILHAIFNSAEFDPDVSYRYLPWQFLEQPLTGPQQKLMAYIDLNAELDVTNAAILAYRWIRGDGIGSLENSLGVRSGVLTALFAEAASIFRGLADVIFAASSQRPGNILPASLDESTAHLLTIFVAPFRALAKRLTKGLPEEVIWMAELECNGLRLLGRPEIIAFRNTGMITPDQLVDGGKKSAVIQALSTVSSRSKSKANAVVEAARAFKCDARDRLQESQQRRLPAHASVIDQYYLARDKDFETFVEHIWTWTGLTVTARDDGTVSMFPDFIIGVGGANTWAVECKSKQAMGYVAHSDATSVISKASTNGYGSSFKVTICQPFVSTDVPRKIALCEELSIVNAEDLMEGAVRVQCGKLSAEAFRDWLSRPGQAHREFLSSAE